MLFTLEDNLYDVVGPVTEDRLTGANALFPLDDLLPLPYIFGSLVILLRTMVVLRVIDLLCYESDAKYH